MTGKQMPGEQLKGGRACFGSECDEKKFLTSGKAQQREELAAVVPAVTSCSHAGGTQKPGSQATAWRCILQISNTFIKALSLKSPQPSRIGHSWGQVFRPTRGEKSGVVNVTWVVAHDLTPAFNRQGQAFLHSETLPQKIS